MKYLILTIVFGFSTFVMASQEMPELHRINSYTFSKPYSCGGSYEISALFLTKYSKSRNAPELLYNGACGSGNYIQARTAGDDFALISDLGEVPLEIVTSAKALNFANVVGKENLFKERQVVKTNHTYVVLISKSEIRALYVIKITSQIQDGPMTIEYAVKSYAIQETKMKSSGFDWEKGND